MDLGGYHSRLLTVRLGDPFNTDMLFPRKSLRHVPRDWKHIPYAATGNELPEDVLSDRIRERIADALGRPPTGLETKRNTAAEWFRSDGEAAVILRGLHKMRLYALAKERTGLGYDAIHNHLKAGEICAELRLLMDEWMLSHRKQVQTVSGGLPGGGSRH